MNEIYAFLIAGGVFIFLIVFILNFLTQNWLLTFFLVKASRGKKVLIEVLGATRSYFVIGTPAEGELTYKDSSKLLKRSSVNPGNFIRRWGIESAYVDEETNGIVDFREAFKAVTGYDNTKADRLVARVIAAKVEDKLRMIILIGLAIAILAGLAGAYFGYQTSNAVGELPLLVQSLKDACAQNVV